MNQLQTLSLNRLSRFDRVVIGAILLLSILIVIVLWQGDHSTLEITHFSWQGQKIGTQDRQFSLSFNRPVDRTSVEHNLTIEPSLGGKFSWSGSNLFYTLTELPIYGIDYQLKLSGVKKQFGVGEMAPFLTGFKTRDRAFVYVGIQEKERGRLILYNITTREKTTLTPPDLIVTDFKIYPNGDLLLFSAFDKGERWHQRLPQQQLYTVTTGLNFKYPHLAQQKGKLDVLLDAKSYQNLGFDLSENGKMIVVQRENWRNPADSGLWVIPEGGKPRPLGIPGGDFILTPDGQKVAVSQRGGIAKIPLTPEAGASEFLPGYEKILAFSKDGSRQLMVKDNLDYTRSLFLVNSDGQTQELLKSYNPIVSCQFEPRQDKTLYCIKTDIVAGEAGQYQEEPFLAAIDLETGKNIPLLSLPNYRDVQLSMSPDGVALLFDQVVTTLPSFSKNSDLLSQGKQVITDGRLWLLALPELETHLETNPNSLKVVPEELYPGFKPQWLP
jgi:hypothetical protein